MWTSNFSIKHSPIKILKNFKVYVPYHRRRLNEENFTVELNENFKWKFSIKNAEDVEKIHEYESILFDNDILTISQNQIKRALFGVIYFDRNDASNQSDEDCVWDASNKIKILSEYFNHNLVKIKLYLHKIQDAEFYMLTEDLNSLHSLKYISFFNISVNLAAKFLQDYKRFTYLKRLSFKLKRN